MLEYNYNNTDSIFQNMFLPHYQLQSLYLKYCVSILSYYFFTNFCGECPQEKKCKNTVLLSLRALGNMGLKIAHAREGYKRVEVSLLNYTLYHSKCA